MKKIIISVLLITYFLTGCAPNSKELKKALKDDPGILFGVIEDNPDKFMEILNKIARNAQQRDQQKTAAEEQKNRDQEFSNPLKPNIEENRAIFGNLDAPITIVEYSDFECPYCSRSFETVKQVLKEYEGKVRVIYKHLPLDFHPNALPAAKMFEAIAKQDPKKAEKFHDLIFKNQEQLKTKGQLFIKKIAKDVGADLKKLEKDLKGAEIMTRITADTEEAKKFGISGTPGFIINGVSIRGAYPFSEFKAIIDRHLGKK